MKIIHALNHFLPHHIAGTEMYVYTLAKAMNKCDLESLVIIPNYGAQENEEYLFENIRVIKYAEPSIVDRALQMGKRNPDGLPFFMELIKREQPGIIHFHELAGSNGITLSHVKAASETGCKVMMTFHLARYSCQTGTLMYKNEVPCDGFINIKKCTLCCYHKNGLSDATSALLLPLAKLLYSFHVDACGWNNRVGTALSYPFIIDQLKKNLQLLAGYCDRMVVISKWYREVLLLNGVAADKMILIEQGAFNVINTLPQSTKASLPVKIIFVGRIAHFKGVNLLIEVMKKLSPEKITLDIYGDSGDKDYMDQCRKDSEKMINICWKGRLSPDKVVTTMSQYDLLCLPSTVCEMSPLVVQEALAAGIPVIASNVYGNAEQIKEGINGWLFKMNDSNDLMMKMKMLIEHPEMLYKAKNKIQVPRTFEKVVSEYINLYKELLSST
ncbi:MAG: glycosyltransferase [Bacteroidota bacterium]|nr:glycosyltransferase [Bacteroidota bacterium]